MARSMSVQEPQSPPMPHRSSSERQAAPRSMAARTSRSEAARQLQMIMVLLRLSLSCSEHSSVHPSSRQIMIGVVAFLVIFLLAVARKGAFPRQATAIAVASVSEHNRFLLDPLANFERFLLTVEKSQGKLRPHYIITARITGASGPHPPPAGSAAAGAGSTATGSNNRALARSRSSSSNTGRDC